MALYNDKKKKKDQVQRLTDTGTGNNSQSKPQVYKPGAKKVSTPAPTPTPKPTTTTATVAKPGVTKGATSPKTRNAPTRQTDTGTRLPAHKKLPTPSKREAPEVSTTREQRLSDAARTNRLREERRQAEQAMKRYEQGQGDTRRGANRSNSGFSYKGYVAQAKAEQYNRDAQAENAARILRQEQHDQALAAWDLDAKNDELAGLRKRLDDAWNSRDLSQQIHYAYTHGDKELAQRLAQKQADAQKNAPLLAQQIQDLEHDLKRAKALQYSLDGADVMDKLRDSDAGAWDLINSLAQRTGYTTRDTGDLPVAPSQNGTFDIDPNMVAALTAEDDETRALLKKMGYSDKDIEQLTDYRIRQINRENYERAVAQAQQFAQDKPVGASVVSVGTNIGAGLGFVDSAVQKLRNPDRPVDYYSDSNLPSAYTNAIRGQVSQDLIDKYGEKGKIYSFLYQSGMSIADSGVNMLLSAAGIPEVVGLMTLAGSAATSSMKEAHDRGLSDSQALGIGLIAGAAEYGTEKIGLDAFMNTVFKRAKGSPAVARALLTNVFAEGGEEVASDVINLAADILISKDKSEWEQSIQRYRDLGFTDSEAFGKALGDQARETGMSFLGGALAGGVMGGGGLVLNHLIDNHTEELLYAGYAAGEGTDVNAAAQDLMGLQRKLSIKEQAGEKLTEDDQKAYTAAVDQLKSAMDALDPEVRRDLMKVGRETRKEMARDAKAAKKAAKQVSRMVKETAQNQRQTETTETVETVETVENGSTEAVEQPSKPRYSDNATVQQAAELVAEGRTSKAVTTVMQNAEAQAGLGLDFSRDATNKEKRTAIKTALEALVQENTAAPVEVNNSTEAAPEVASPAAVSDEAETETETRWPTAEDSSEEATAVVPDQMISYETFAKDLREGNPDVTEEESRALYKEVQQVVEASQYATERDGQKVYLQSADRVVDYKEFRGMAQAEAKRNGVTYEEAVIRDAFDTAFRETQTGVQEHETRRREKLNKTAENINKAFDAHDLGFRVRVSYDGADFAARGVKENAFVDVKNHEIVFNGDVMDSSGAMLWYLGHEVFHPAADVDTELVDTVIDTFQKLLDAGKLTGRLAAMVRNADAQIARTRELYQRHENELAEKAGRKAETISEAQAREEFAADLMRYAFSSTQLCKDIVGQKPTVAMRMRQAVSRVLKTVSGGDDSDTSLRDELQKLADRLDAALERVSDNVKNADVETLTADNMSTDDLSGVTDTKGERMFSLSTMRQDIDGYMQDLRDAGLVGEGKVMTEAEVTGLYDGINRVMNFVEKHIDEIERNENYRDMTAETRPFSPYKPNSDPHYKMALDFSTLCRKRLLTQAITERLQKALGRALTPVEQVKIRDMIKKLQAEGKKIDVACALCYVEAARLKSPKVINDFLAHRADNIWNYHSLQDKTFKNDVYAKRSGDWKEQHGLPRSATKDQIKAAGFKVNEYNKFMLAVRKNYQNWLQQNNPERFAALEKAVADAEALDASAFLSAQSLARMRQDNPDLYDTFITKVRQATRSKAQETDVPYVRGDVNQVGEALIEQMNEESGFRHQSWSDFQAMHLLDSIAAIIELSTRKAKMHTYTKVADMVRFLGNTGMMMNMSLIPAGETGFDENGNLLFDPVEGMEYQTMLGLRRKFHATAGNIAIGISDAQILAMMASDEIDYIIPYHTSGLNADMRKRMGIKAWQDYTKSQNEKGDDWDKKAPKLQEWYNEKAALLAPDGVAYMVEASKKYLQLCHERGLVPKFSQFLQKNSDGSYTLRGDAQNYWKLLIDRKMVDQYTGGVIAQQAVVPRFDVDTMLDILSGEVNSQAAKDAREAEDYIVQKVLENGEGIVSKAERAELENRARILRDAALRGIVQNAAEEMGFGKESTDAVDDRQFSISMHNANSDAPIPAMDNTGAALTTNQVALFNDGGIVDRNGKLVRLYRFERYGGARKMNLHKHGVGAYFLTTDPNVARSYQTGTDAMTPTFSAPQDLVDYLNNADKKYSYTLDGNTLRRVEKATGELDLVLRYKNEAELTEKALTDVMNAFGTEGIGTPETLEGYARVSRPWHINADYKNWNAVMHPDLKGTYRVNARNLRTDLAEARKALYGAKENVSPEQVQELLGYYFPDGEVTLALGEPGVEDAPGTVQGRIMIQYNWSKNDVDTVEVPFDVKWNGYDYLGFSREAARAVSEAERILSLRVLRSTDELAQIARDRGYDSIILDNVTDVGGNTDIAADTIAADIILLDDSPNGAQFKLTDNKDPTYGEDFRFSIENVGGETMAVTDFSGTPSTQEAAEKYLEGIVGSPEVFARTLDGATEVYLGEDLPGEYAYSKNSRMSNFFERLAKMKAVTVLDEMILLGENGRWSQNAKDHHGNEAKYGWTRYDTTFGLRTKKSVKVYDAVVLLRNDADGKTYLYDITNVKEKKTVPLDTATQERRAPNNVPAILGAEPSSKVQYTTEDEKVNREYSISPEQDEEYLDLAKDPVKNAARLQEMVDAAADAAGYTIKAYHGTTADFTKFSREKMGQNFKGYLEYGAGFYFTPSEKEAKSWADRAKDLGGQKVMSVYLSADKTLNADDPVNGGVEYLRTWLDEAGANFVANRGYRFINYLLEDLHFTNVEVQEVLKALGYEAVDATYRNKGQFIVFDPEQIKSADPVTYDNNGNIIPLSQRFDSSKQDIRFSIDPNYASDIDIWEKNGQPQDWAFTLGSTGDVLQGLGAQDRRIYMNAEKILQIQQVDHPGMTTDVIKKLPEVLENPALILKSRRQNSRGATDRLVVYGSLKDANGAPVAVILDLDPQEGKLHVTDCYKVVSAYGKDDENAPKAVKKSYVMYADKKRAPHLLRALGFSNPSARTPGPLNAQGTGAGYSFTGSINNADRFVNTYGKPFSSIFSYDETAAAGEDAETAANRDYSLSDNDQTDYDPNDDPMMQAFFDAYEEAHGEGQTKIDYPTLNQRLRAAERARKKAEVQLASEQAKRSLAEAETKDTRLAWQNLGQKLRTKDREYRAKMSALRREKMEAVKAAVQQTREVERATAAVKLDEQKMAERMNAGRKQAAMRQGVREDTYARKAKEQDNAKLRRNAAKAALRNKNLAEKKREKAEIEQGPVSTLRKTAKERKAMENRQNLGQKLRTKGRALYRDFVNKCMAIDFDVSRRQRGGMKAGTLATIVGSVGSTTETMFTDALVDRAGNRIGESMTNVFLCTEGDKGKVIDENRQRLLQDYMLHRHNIDRMSIVANTRARLEAFEAENPWLSEMDGKEFARLVALTDKEAEKSGQTRARELARQYGNLLQELNEARDKPVFPDQKGNPVTAETSREKVEQYEAENPWLKDKAEGIYKWWDSFMRAWVVGDSITEEQYDRMRELYPHYVPTYRVDKGGMGFSFTSSNGATPGQLVKKATGSLREIVNIEDSFANLVAKAVKQARVNELYKNLIDTAMLDSDGVFADCMFFDWLEYGKKTGTRDLAMLDVGEQLELREKAGLTKDGSGYRVSAWYDGELVPVYVSEDLFQSLSDTVGASSDKLDKVARLGSKLTAPMKTAITGINPNFALRNVTRDLPTAIINSTSGLAFPVYWAKAWKHMLSNSEHWQRYNALGGGNALYYNTEGGFGKNMNMEAGARGSMQRGWDKVKTAIGVVNESTEAVTRFAEYLATVERLGDTYEARLQGIKNAAEVTVDFSRHGRYGKAINAWIPYWNPAVQGIDKVIRSVVETPEGQTKVGHALRTLGRAAVTTALLDAVMQLIYNALGKRDDWDELDDRTKDTYYCIPTGDHTFIKIPKNREWGAILGTPLMRLIEGYNGRENPFENYIETSIIPNFLPGMPTDMIGFSQYIDLATNKDFAGRTIVPYAYQQGSKAGQYDSETSGLSHWLSDRIGNAISPMQLDYIIKDYFGDFGKMFTMATSEGLWSGEKTPEEVADYALDIVKKPWEADNRFSNQYTSRYYETISQLEDTYNDKKNHSDGDSYKNSVEYQTYQAMNKLYGKQISEISKGLRDETDEEAKAAGKAQIVQLAKQALAFYDDCMSGKVSNPELTAKYDGLPGSVSDELIRLDGLGKEYSFRPSESTTSSYVDQTSKVNGKATREYVLDDEAKAKLNGLREERYVDYFQRTINTQAYKNAPDTGKATLLEEARDNAYADAKEEFMAWLVKNRRPTPRK